MRKCRFPLFIASILVWLSLPVRAATEPSDEVQRVVFLLQYIGTDYGAAVRNGGIIDELEYREMVEFASLAAQRFARIRDRMPAAKANQAGAAIDRLGTLIHDRDDPSRVREVTESAIPLLVEAFDLRPYPREVPRPARAAELFRDNCATCHGSQGRGDGERAAELDPRPASFADAERMAHTAPYVFYNAITFGIAGTAMASFAESLSDQERWDLAFYLWTFVGGEAAGPAGVTISLRDLATKTANDLVPDVIRRATREERPLGEDDARRLIADLRARPRALPDHTERLARVRHDLLESAALVERGDLDAAVDRVTSVYLTDFEPLEPEIDRIDSAVRQRFERGLIDFRGALRRNDRHTARAVTRELIETVDAAEELLREGRGPSGGATLVFLGVVGLVMVGGMAAMVFVRRSRDGVGKPPPEG